MVSIPRQSTLQATTLEGKMRFDSDKDQTPRYGYNFVDARMETDPGKNIKVAQAALISTLLPKNPTAALNVASPDGQMTNGRNGATSSTAKYSSHALVMQTSMMNSITGVSAQNYADEGLLARRIVANNYMARDSLNRDRNAGKADIVARALNPWQVNASKDTANLDPSGFQQTLEGFRVVVSRDPLGSKGFRQGASKSNLAMKGVYQ
jgi:hypothetical protein